MHQTASKFIHRKLVKTISYRLKNKNLSVSFTFKWLGQIDEKIYGLIRMPIGIGYHIKLLPSKMSTTRRICCEVAQTGI